MDRIVEFAGNHLLLVSAFVVILTLLIVDLLKDAASGAQRLRSAQAVRMLNDDAALAVDLREARDYDSGHIVDALHLPYGKLAGEADGALPDRERPLILYCNSGAIAGRAATELRKKGYTRVHTLSGGIMAWRNDGLPLERA